MSDKYAWAQNPLKLQFAIDEVNERKSNGEKIGDFDEEVKAAYIRRAGVVKDIEQKDRGGDDESDDLEGKVVAELREIADGLDLDTEGFKKAELIEAIREAQADV